MGSIDLFSICVSAMAVVFGLLALLALVMRLIMKVFPEKVAKSDSAVLAAVASVVAVMYPGTKITKVEELT